MPTHARTSQPSTGAETADAMPVGDTPAGTARHTASTQATLLALPSAAPDAAGGGRLINPDGTPWRPDPAQPTPTWVLSYGMGVDSTALLVRWLLEPETRPFTDLGDLLVVTAHTGDEWESTYELVTAHVLPLLAAHQVRYVQVARAGAAAADGIVVLSDTRTPAALARGGHYRLSDELASAGTVPNVAQGQRRCSQKAKAAPLDALIDAVTGGAEFTHVMGFEAGEGSRVDKDRGYSTVRRATRYPLLEWGWDRAACLDYLRRVFEVTWEKSACWCCPFVFSARDPGRVTARFSREPAAAARALLLEDASVALNPNVPLFGNRRARDVVAAAGLTDVLAAADALAAAVPWSLVEVRRVLPAAGGDPTRKGMGWRSVRTLASGPREQMLTELHRAPARAGGRVEPGADQVPRAWLHRRADTYPTFEQLLVLAPASVQDKERSGFAALWAKVTGRGQGELFDDPAA